MLESLYNNVAGLLACNFFKKETLAQVFSCEFCEISKNTFLQRTPLVAASIIIPKPITNFVHGTIIVPCIVLSCKKKKNNKNKIMQQINIT